MAFLASVVKKSTDLPEDVGLLSLGVRVLSNEVAKLAQGLAQLAKVVQHHNEVITELYTVQALILQSMRASSSSSMQMPPLHPEKSDKPN